MGRGRSVLVTALLSLLVTGGAVGASYYLRTRAAVNAAPATPSSTPQPGATVCRVEPCLSLGTVTVGSTKIELIADASGQSARVRIFERPGEEKLIESSLPARGVRLTTKSLHCVAGTLSACLIRGEVDGQTLGEVIVGRSGKWSETPPKYSSNANYLSLLNVLGTDAPEVVVVQRGYFAQVFSLDGVDQGCTNSVTKPESLAGWPDAVKPAPHQLRKPCP